MDARVEMREFLRSRRARITPEQAGLVGGGRRRVPGLRREEVALLADISVDYYGQLERGELGTVSDAVLAAVADALQLDRIETMYLFDLAHAAARRRVSVPRVEAEAVPPTLLYLLTAITGVPAWIRNQRMDFLAANRLGFALFSPLFEDAQCPVNNARFIFLNPKSHEFYADRERWARSIASRLRGYALFDPDNARLMELIDELNERSDDFRRRWAAQDVSAFTTESGAFNHPVVGELRLHAQGMNPLTAPGLTLFTYIPDPGSVAERRLRQLDEWAVAEGLGRSPLVQPSAESEGAPGRV